MALHLLPRERRLHRSNANLVVVSAQYGLSDFAGGRLAALAGMAGKESIGGRVHVTSLRVAFAAHPVNRLRGVFTVPLPLITAATPWRSGISFGFEVTTPAAAVQFVSWSRRAVLAAIRQAQDAFGDAEQALIDERRGPPSRPATQALDQASAVLFDWIA